MRYSETYTLKFGGSIDDLPKGIRLPIRGGELVIEEIDVEQRRGRAVVTVPVDPAGLSVRESAPPFDEGDPQRGIDVPEKSQLGSILRAGVRIMAFVLDMSIDHSHVITERKLVPESEADEHLLDKFGSLKPYIETGAEFVIQTHRLSELDEVTLEKLLAREVGLALYADALALGQPIGQFRELWRVLESAFGQKDAELIRSLAAFEPALKMGFDKDELEELHVLRGRASHAESAGGLDEYRHLSREVGDRLSRLKCLAEQVVLTKASWGTKGLGVDRLAPLKSYVTRDGTWVLIRGS